MRCLWVASRSLFCYAIYAGRRSCAVRTRCFYTKSRARAQRARDAAARCYAARIRCRRRYAYMFKIRAPWLLLHMSKIMPIRRAERGAPRAAGSVTLRATRCQYAARSKRRGDNRTRRTTERKQGVAGEDEVSRGEEVRSRGSCSRRHAAAVRRGATCAPRRASAAAATTRCPREYATPPNHQRAYARPRHAFLFRLRSRNVTA